MANCKSSAAGNQPQPTPQIFPAVTRREQRELFQADLPDRPYCMTREDGRPSGRMRIRPLFVAARYPYIQINPPWLTVALLFDIDRPAGAAAWYLHDLPEPVATVENRANGHAHIIYVLSAPVLTGYNARKKPQALMAAIYGAMTERMEADPGYSGLIAKNPLAGRMWRVLWSQQPARYELKFLTEFLTDRELKRHLPCRTNRPHLTGPGRNVDTFNAARTWAYRAVKQYWDGNATDWYNAVLCHVETINGDYTNPMLFGECKAIAKSISKYTWTRFSPAAFSAIQRARGKRSGVARRELKPNADRDAGIIEAYINGDTQPALAAAHGLSQGRISQIIAAAGLAKY